MNDVFSLRRFGWLMRKIFLERTMQVLGTLLLCFTVTFIVYFMTRLLLGIEEAQNAAFLVGLTLGGSLMASIVFSYFNNNAVGVSFITLPASLLEKWLSGILIVGVLYFLLFLAFFRLIDLSFVLQYHHNLDHHAPYYKEQYEAVYLLSFSDFTAWGNYAMFFNFAGIMMLGSLFFNKAAFVKTALVICVVIVGTFLLNLLVISLLIKNTQTAFPFSIVWIWVGKYRAPIELSPETADKIKIIFRFVLPAILWSLSLLRLKEKEF
ncbi:hypothetical protein A4D02_14270 [Niastella koreensis]|uniref:Uncharacterized protein n=2 Tax=Niastella koreensis TaxID=354356 RepID=G8TRJ2_NIAKG|nr:hypothetical protein [Niastella koreensis]AEW01123.1 hypothetical protein Niako_4880 [Niastella koreensis GR20-10]OQP41840.1 hypothetical protein A4D02_14270 [Niastella koreensis]